MMAAEPILLQFASSPGDSPAVQALKLQKLWLLQQVYHAFESRAVASLKLPTQQQHHAPAAAQGVKGDQCDVAADIQALVAGHVTCGKGADDLPQHSLSCQHNQQQDGRTRQQQQQRKQHTHLGNSSLPRQHQPAPLRQLLGSDSIEDQVPADMQQQSDQGPHQHNMQDAGHMMPPPALQQPASHRDLLACLLLPGHGRSGPAAGAGAGAAASIPTGHGRQRRLPHTRHSGRGGPDRAACTALTAAAAAAADPQQPAWQEGVEDSPGPVQQQQMLHMRAQYLYDAQSQAQGAAAAAAAGPVAMQRPVLAAQQQLFSPRTATHAPAAGSRGSNSTGLAHSGCQQCKTPSAEVQASAQHQQADVPQAELPEEIEVTPAHPRGGQLAATSRAAAAQQQCGSGLFTAVAAVTTGKTAAAVAGGGAARGSGVLPVSATAATPGVVHDLDLEAAAAASGSVVQTPATAHTELIAAAGSRRAAAAADLAAALFHTPGSTAARHPHLKGVSLEPAGAAGAMAGQHAAGRLQCIAESPSLGNSPPSSVQHVNASVGATPLALPAQHSVMQEEAAAAAGTGQAAGTSVLDETQPPSQPQQDEGALLPGRQSDVPSQVAATPASNTAPAGALPSAPYSSVAGKRKSADAAALMLPPPPVTALGERSPAQAQPLLAGSPADQHARQRNKKPQPSPLNPACRQAPAAAIAAAAPTPGSKAKLKAPEHVASAFSSGNGSMSFVLDHQQQRLHELHVGLPIAHIMCCGSYAAALLQDPLGSSAHRLMILHTARAQQQQQQQRVAGHGVMQKSPQQQQQQLLRYMMVTAQHTSVFVGPAQQPGPMPARRSSPAQQQQGRLHSDMLRAGLLLLPQSWAASDKQQQAGPLLAVASELQIHLAPTAAAAAADVTPGAAQQPKLAALHSAGSSKRKLPHPAADAVQGGDTSPCAGLVRNHTVSIYQLKQSRGSVAPSGKSKSSSTGADLLYSLPVAHAVRCLAACEGLHLLAAGGYSGFACVWPLQQQPVSCPPATTAAKATGNDQCAVPDAAAAMVLPSACYRGVVFPDISELCFVTTGANVSDQASGQRLLLVGASSLGCVAVWDVGRGQQVIAVHCPDLRLSGLMAPTSQSEHAALVAAMRAAQAAAGSDAGAEAAGCTQQAAGGGVHEPVVFLATVRSIDNSPDANAGQQQQGMQQLRAVVLHSTGEMQVGAGLLAAGRQGGIHIAALAGNTAAAVTAAGVVQVWDVLSGRRLMALKPRSRAVGRSSAGTVAVLTLSGLLSPETVGAAQGCDGVKTFNAEEAICCNVVLTGSESGVLTAALV